MPVRRLVPLVLCAALIASGPRSGTTRAGAPDVAPADRASSLAWRAVPADRLPDDDLQAGIVVDVDGDGDTDVLALSDADDVVILVNDGLGRLTRTEPRPVPPSLTAGAAWQPLPAGGLPGVLTLTRSAHSARPASPFSPQRPPGPGVPPASDAAFALSEAKGGRVAPRGPPVLPL